ncbi:MAG TPA: ECF transporter S component [Acidimicrobiales bacterium]|nr:ECF transporter S component [Acidimicrobiales bacterium]
MTVAPAGGPATGAPGSPATGAAGSPATTGAAGIPAASTATGGSRVGGRRPALVYALVVLVGAGSFLYPFWLPARALPAQAHAGDAPLVGAVVAALAVTAMVLEVRRGTMNGATVALLGVLGASAGLLRLLDLPGGGSGVFFLVVLAGAAFGPRFGLLLGFTAMATSAVLTGGIGPWLPFQMLALAWLGAGAGLVGRLTVRARPRVEVAVLAAYGWMWGFLYGAILNLWFWPFVRNGGPLDWEPGLGLAATLRRYWSFYVVTSAGWDAAGALANAALVAATGAALLPAMRRFAVRLEPVTEFGDHVSTEGGWQQD